MDYEQIKQRLAPCGLYCGKCFAFIDGDIAKNSKKLKESIGNFDVYAERFVDLIDEPIFKKYSDFKDLLQYFSNGNCGGCRKEKCKIFKDCKVRECYEKKAVDFCFQCSEFPCNNTGFDKHLQDRSVEINILMKEIGVEEYYNTIKDKPRY
ncbi:MAG: DUF3795 domain-containing protein [Candidatus Pacebacteria bacterium]|nr:DUF3795 domain-containing protein [Candidatus Paceibacterota bacterium]